MAKDKLKDKKIVVGLSGGVDSSIALFLLKKQGWNVVGLSLKLPTWSSNKAKDKRFNSAKKICQKLKVPFYVLNVEKDFKNKVVDYFIKEFKTGNTPNPCIICNRYLKFSKLINFAKKKKIKYVATGHYALVRKFEAQNSKLETYQLLKAKDKVKDQSYYLSFLNQNQLKHIVFPLGEYTKKQVIKLAKNKGFDFLINQKQSQDFCYLAGSSVSDFLKNTLNKKPGDIVDTKGEIIGKHKGLHFYTIGQRKGLRISGGPYYVNKLDIKNNQIVVTKNKKNIFKKEVYLSPFNFISGKAIKRKAIVSAKVRYQQKQSQAVLYPPKENKLKIVFKKPQLAVTPGQFAVFYKGKVCLGGGRIIN